MVYPSSKYYSKRRQPAVRWWWSAARSLAGRLRTAGLGLGRFLLASFYFCDPPPPSPSHTEFTLKLIESSQSHPHALYLARRCSRSSAPHQSRLKSESEPEPTPCVLLWWAKLKKKLVSLLPATPPPLAVSSNSGLCWSCLRYSSCSVDLFFIKTKLRERARSSSNNDAARREDEIVAIGNTKRKYVFRRRQPPRRVKFKQND